MNDTFVTAAVSIVGSLIGLAALSVILSKNAQTSTVIKAASGGLAQDIQAAVAPVSGGFGGMTSFGNGL